MCSRLKLDTVPLAPRTGRPPANYLRYKQTKKKEEDDASFSEQKADGVMGNARHGTLKASVKAATATHKPPVIGFYRPPSTTLNRRAKHTHDVHTRSGWEDGNAGFTRVTLT